MAIRAIDAKQIQKISNVTGNVPTIGVSPDYTDGTWSVDDIYRGEFYLNDPDGRLWIGTVNGPLEIELAGGAGNIWSRVGEDIVAVENGLTSPLIYPNVLPPADVVSDLGSATYNWNDLFINNIELVSAGVIKSQNGGGQIDLDYFGAGGDIFISTDNGVGIESYIYVSPTGGVDIHDLKNTNEESYITAIGYTMHIGVRKNVGGASQYTAGIDIGLTRTASVTSNLLGLGDTGVIINSQASTINSTVLRSVIVGGTGITATADNTCYVQNFVAHDGSIEIASIDTANTAFTFGFRTGAVGLNSFVQGGTTVSNTASGGCSHAEGNGTTASGDWSHAEGYNTTASGDYSHAEGLNTVVSGIVAHAEGQNTTASGNVSHAEGLNTVASDDYSHAEGVSTTASGNSSHAGGLFAISNHWAEWSRSSNAAGQYGILSFYKQTTNATPAEAFLDNSTLRFTVSSGDVYKVWMTCIAHDTATGDAKEFSALGVIKNVGGTTSLVGGTMTVNSTIADASLATATMTMTADDANDALVPTVTGIAATTIDWFIKCEYEMLT